MNYKNSKLYFVMFMYFIVKKNYRYTIQVANLTPKHQGVAIKVMIVHLKVYATHIGNIAARAIWCKQRFKKPLVEPHCSCI